MHTVKRTLKDMQELARLKGGRCLSKEYWDLHTPLEWRCSEGHTWEATPSIINQGGWCQQCLIKGQKLEELQEIAESNGGKCLSPKYINTVTMLRWECAEGHRWVGRPFSVKKCSWCPYCAGLAKHTIEEMQALAKSRGGKCLSKKYVNAMTRLRWQCKQGHRWLAKPNNIISLKQWCPHCAHKVKLTIGEFRALAKSKGGKCLSERYIDIHTKLEWECKKGHRWKTTPHVVKIDGAWCPYCSNRVRRTIEEMRALAESRGGKCLSMKYFNANTKLEWKCEKGHRWSAKPVSIKQGAWCPYCAHHVKLTIGEMQELAKSRGGKCLSKEYVNNHTKLKWECKNGHRWESTPKSVKKGNWCIYCAGLAKHTIEDMQALAKGRGGRCLSKNYINSITKLEWECKNEHRWSAKPGSVKHGSWCPYCARTFKHTIGDNADACQKQRWQMRFKEVR